MPQKTDAVIAELMDRRLLNDVDPDLHQEIAKAVVKAVHTASLQGEDAVERVAQLIEDHVTAHCDDERCQTWLDNTRDAAEATLATGLVPDEAAIRADEREKCAKVAEAECYATTGRQIAAAIRSNGRGA